MMKTSKFSALRGALVASLMLAGSVAGAAENDAPTTVNIDNPISIGAGSVLNFGTLMVGTTGGTVTMANDGTVTAPQGSDIVASGATSTAKFDVVGRPNTAFSATVTATQLTGNGTPMDMTAAVVETNPTLDEVGEATITVKGALDVAGNQLKGIYDGTVTVTVDYL